MRADPVLYTGDDEDALGRHSRLIERLRYDHEGLREALFPTETIYPPDGLPEVVGWEPEDP